MNNTTLIVDASHLIYRNLSTAGKDLYTKSNLPVKGVYGVLSSINKILEERPNINKIYMAFDGFSKYRNELYPEYKANREHNPEDKRYQEYIKPDDHGWSRKDTIKWTVNKLKEIAPKFCMHVVYNEDAEGDDMGYQLAKQLYGQSDIVFMTDDKDWLQLINLFPESTVYRAVAEEIITAKNFEATQEVPANWFIFQKIMLGDKSDNISSVIPGCGEKAIGLLISEAIKNDIKPESETLWEELGMMVEKMELGRHKNLINIKNLENKLIYERNKKLIDFRMAQIPTILNESLNEILNLDFDEAASIIRELEFRTLSKIIAPGSPWYRLK